MLALGVSNEGCSGDAYCTLNLISAVLLYTITYWWNTAIDLGSVGWHFHFAVTWFRPIVLWQMHRDPNKWSVLLPSDSYACDDSNVIFFFFFFVLHLFYLGRQIALTGYFLLYTDTDQNIVFFLVLFPRVTCCDLGTQL